jgi:hypothetical protein
MKRKYIPINYYGIKREIYKMSNTVTPVAKLSNANKFLSKPYDKEMRQRWSFSMH